MMLRLGFIALILLIGYTALNYFLDDNITHLAGHYYTANSGNGTALHVYQDATKPNVAPLLDRVYGVRVTSDYLIARAGANLYFMYPVRVVTLEEAQQQQLGPFSRAEFVNKLLQTIGDTTLKQVGPF